MFAARLAARLDRLSLMLFALLPLLALWAPATRAEDSGGSAPADGVSGLENIRKSMREVFMVKPFPMKTEICGRPQTFAEGEGLVLCQELLFGISQVTGDDRIAQDFTFFLVVHQFGHIAMQQWGDPQHADEERADRFATAVVIMSDQRQQLRNATRYLTRVRSKRDRLNAALGNDRHWPDNERMQRLYEWSANDEEMRVWQRELIPRMTKETLKKLMLAPPPWTDTSVVAEELGRRDIEL